MPTPTDLMRAPLRPEARLLFLTAWDKAADPLIVDLSGRIRNWPWFIAVAPIDDPRIAIAVTVEQQPPGSQGGTVAAPIAKSVLEALLGGEA